MGSRGLWQGDQPPAPSDESDAPYSFWLGADNPERTFMARYGWNVGPTITWTITKAASADD